MLTDAKIRSAKPHDKSYKLSDGHGLYLLVMASGSKYWRLKYRIHGKEKKLSIGVYPDLALVEAREKATQARKLLAEGIDPSFAKKERKRHSLLNAKNTFEAVAREWHENQLSRWTPKHGQNVLHFLSTDIFPFIGERPIPNSLTAMLINGSISDLGQSFQLRKYRSDSSEPIEE
ncbi:MAG: Arm DNA-binding domain-containing protein [bacterium]|nr:Arm DNA-binding domain-containing protein [bacterium]